MSESEFLEYYRDLSAAIDYDPYFELVLRNAWHISGGQGVSANTSCRRVVVVRAVCSPDASGSWLPGPSCAGN